MAGANRLTALTYPDGMEILYSYDDLGRTTEIRRYVDGSNDEILMSSLQYTVESLLTQCEYGNGLRSFFSYDSEDRLSTIDVKDGETSYLDLDFTYDDNSNITQIVNGWRDTDSDWNSDTESYSYDGLDRLVSASSDSWSHTYSYDKAGNRTAKDSITYTLNSVNEITALSDGTSFTYDDNGNRTQKMKGTDTWVYTYDYANRLTKVEKNAAVLGEYIYDGEGKRIRRTEDNVTTTYVYFGLGVAYEENTTGAATYIYGPMGRLAKRTTISGESTLFYYHTDQLGSTRLVTDGSKNIVSAATYHPFGELHSEEGDENYLFAGKEKDSTDLYYFGARYYDCETGTFITRDPVPGTLLNPQSFNQYAYCQNNPVKYVDLWGLYKNKELDLDRDDTRSDEREKGGMTDIIREPWEPHEWFHFEEGWLVPITPIFVVGNVGVGIASYQTLNTSSQSMRVYDNHGYGLLIVIFDSSGNIVEIFFIPFEDLQDDDTARGWINVLSREFAKYGVSWGDFSDALEALRKYCKAMADFINAGGMGVDLAAFGSSGAVACIYSAEAAAALIGGLATGGILLLLGGGLYLEAKKWSDWESIIAHFDHLISEYLRPPPGGGF